MQSLLLDEDISGQLFQLIKEHKFNLNILLRYLISALYLLPPDFKNSSKYNEIISELTKLICKCNEEELKECGFTDDLITQIKLEKASTSLIETIKSEIKEIIDPILDVIDNIYTWKPLVNESKEYNSCLLLLIKHYLSTLSFKDINFIKCLGDSGSIVKSSIKV